jgi:hypothetical protein
MKINKKALELIEKGLSSNTVSKLTESQVQILHSKLFISEQVTEVPSKKTYKVGPKGGSLPPNDKGYSVRQDPNTREVVATAAESELDEDIEVTTDPNKEVETQDPKQVGPSSDDGFGDETDGMGMFEGKEKNKPNPWAICHSQVGPKKSRKWERCVKEVKKQLEERKNPVSLYLESQIMKIVEKNLPPRITKGDLIKHLVESGPSIAPSKPKTKPTTKPGTKPQKPAHPGKNPNPGEQPAPKAKRDMGEQGPATAPTKPVTKPTTKRGTKPQRPAHPGKNPNPGEQPAPKAKKVSAEDAKDKVIDVILNLLKK